VTGIDTGSTAEATDPESVKVATAAKTIVSALGRLRINPETSLLYPIEFP
jgi:hypothetical protein